MAGRRVLVSINHPFDESPIPPASAKKSRKPRRFKERPQTTRYNVKLKFVLFIIFALVSGLVAMLVVTDTGSKLYVARVQSPIAAGMVVDLGEGSRIEIVALPKVAVEPGAFSGPSSDEVVRRLRAELTGQQSIYPLSVGQQLRPEFFTGTGSGVPQRSLGRDERQISITAKASRSVAGTIRAGDRVDVYAVTNNGVAGLLGSGVEVVAVSLPPDSLENAASAQADTESRSLAQVVPQNAIGGTYVLKVKAADAAYYFAADIGGQIYLALRGVDAQDVPTEPTNALQAICRLSSSPACR